MTRALLAEERAILEFSLTKQFSRQEQLVSQLEHVQVTGPSCSVAATQSASSSIAIPPAHVEERVPTEAFGRDPAGTVVGVLRHVIDGYMADLEFYSASDVTRFGRPTIDSLRLAEWSVADDCGVRTLVNPHPLEEG